MNNSLFILPLAIAFVLSPLAEAKISIDKGIEIFSEKTKEPSAITVSPDGKLVYWIAKKSEKTKLEPIDSWYSSTEIVNEVKIDRPALNIYTMTSYLSDEKVLIDHEYGGVGALLKTIIHRVFKKEDEPVGYKSCIDIYNLKEKRVEKKLCAKDLGLKHQELIAHARLSPDNNWIAFYIKGAKNPAGIYLYNLNTETLYSLGEFSDKHPTWSSDGKKIMFHYQQGGNVKDENDTEEAWIGWYDLDLNQTALLSAKRNLIDDPNKKDANSYIYQKHPALIPGTNYVIYHGQEKVEGRKKLYVRKMQAGSKVHEISLKMNECKLKSTKHPAIGYSDDYLYFVGKLECDEEKSEAKIFRIELQQIILELDKK